MFCGLRNFPPVGDKITTTFTFFGWTYPLMSECWHTHNGDSNTHVWQAWCLSCRPLNLVIDQSIGWIKLLTRWWQKEGLRIHEMYSNWSQVKCECLYEISWRPKCCNIPPQMSTSWWEEGESKDFNGVIFWEQWMSGPNCTDQFVDVEIFRLISAGSTCWWRYMTCQGGIKVSGLNSPGTTDVCTQFQTIHPIAVEIFNIWWVNQQTNTSLKPRQWLKMKKTMRTTVVIRMTLALSQIPSSVFQLFYPLIFRWYPAECNMDSGDKTETCLVSLWSCCMVKSFLLWVYSLILTRDKQNMLVCSRVLVAVQPAGNLASFPFELNREYRGH